MGGVGCPDELPCMAIQSRSQLCATRSWPCGGNSGRRDCDCADYCADRHQLYRALWGSRKIVFAGGHLERRDVLHCCSRAHVNQSKPRWHMPAASDTNPTASTDHTADQDAADDTDTRPHHTVAIAITQASCSRIHRNQSAVGRRRHRCSSALSAWYCGAWPSNDARAPGTTSSQHRR